MYGFRRSAAICFITMAGLACPPTVPVTTGAKDPHVTTNPMMGEQVEVTVVSAGSLFPSLVAAFNDFSYDPSFFAYFPSLLTRRRATSRAASR